MRLDKFLKVSRLIKRRTVANEACDAGRVLINGRTAKASAAVKAGDVIEIQFGTGTKKVKAEGKEELIPHIPVVSHEIGQYETYPDYREIEKYTGVLVPENLKIFKEVSMNQEIIKTISQELNVGMHQIEAV